MADAATSFDALVDRIYEVLCEGKGAFRALDSSDLFRRGVLPTAGDQKMAIKSRVQKRVIASVEEIRDGVNTQEFSDRAEYTVRVRLALMYSAPNAIETERTFELMTKSKSDAHDVRMALGWPANMAATEAGVSTGLAGGGLVFVRAGDDRLADQARLFTTNISFTATVWLAMPTT